MLSESAEPMNAKSLIDAMAAKGYWTSPGGQTPHATLFAALIREIKVKGAESRFAKVDRGQFALNDGKTPVAAKAAKKAKKAKAEANAAEETACRVDVPTPEVRHRTPHVSHVRAFFVDGTCFQKSET